MFLVFKRRLYSLYFITLLLLELRFQSSELQLLFIRNLLLKLDQSYCSKSCNSARLDLAQLGLVQLGSAWLGSAQLGSARLGSAWLDYIQPIAFKEVDHVSGSVFSVKLRLLRYSLGLNFRSTPSLHLYPFF